MFAIGVAPVGRLIYVEEGNTEDALSARPLREACAPARGRLRAGAAPIAAGLSAGAAAGGGAMGRGAEWRFRARGLSALLLLWLSVSALFYAHLVVVQLYADAGRATRYL